MTKHEALAAVRQATYELYNLTGNRGRGATLNQLRAANAKLAVAQLRAADIGASSDDVTDASTWNGVRA